MECNTEKIITQLKQTFWYIFAVLSDSINHHVWWGATGSTSNLGERSKRDAGAVISTLQESSMLISISLSSSSSSSRVTYRSSGDERILSSSMDTSLMFGRFFPFRLKHLLASFATANTCSCLHSSLIRESTISRTLFSFIASLKWEASPLFSSDRITENGFSPVISSTKTTPKL